VSTDSAHIDLYFTYRVTDPARFEDYLAIVLPLTEAREPYVLHYSLARDEHGNVLQHERYENEAAIAQHLELTAEGQKAWGEATELTDIRFVGPLSDEFRRLYDTPQATWWAHDRSVRR
jgi:quinol monooxygenase YgiN